MKTAEVKNYVSKRIREIESLPKSQKGAELARLRRGVGHIPGDLPDLWGLFLRDMPESFYSEKEFSEREPSREEWAVYLALTLYAVHQQSQDASMHCEGNRLGLAVRELAERTAAEGQDWTESSVLRRFNALATADNMPEISHHLRGIVQLLRSVKGGSIPLDYVQLAADLYRLQFITAAPGVRLGWGQDLYRVRTKEADEEKKENKS